MTQSSSRPIDAPLFGVAMMCFAMICFPAMNALIKELRGELPVIELIWGRYFFHFLLILLLFPRRIPTLLSGRDKGLQIARSVAVLASTACMFTAVGLMPLADVVSLTFIAPLLIVAMSAMLLGEQVGPRRWTAVAVGFLGVLVIVRPGSGIFQLAALLPIGVALTYAIYQIITRQIAHRTDPLTSLFYTAFVGAIAMSAAVPFVWQMPTPEQWGTLILAALLGGIGHFAIIKAYERSEATLVAPFAYTELVWASLWGLALFGDFPDAFTLLGAAIIVASGIYVLHRERQVGVAR